MACGATVVAQVFGVSITPPVRAVSGELFFVGEPLREVDHIKPRQADCSRQSQQYTARIKMVPLPHMARSSPKASPGVISGCLLAVARAAGETAPLIFTIGAAKATNWNVFGGTNTSLSMQIYGNAKESFVTAQERAWGAALTLIALAFLFTSSARLLSARLARTR